MTIISLVVGFFIGQQCKSIPDTVESQIFRKLGIDVEKI